MLLALANDLRSAARRLRRQPVFAAATVLTLGLAIGANTAIFTVVHGVLLRQLPFTAAERLVVLHSRESESDNQPFSIADFMDLRAPSRSLDGLVAYASWGANLTGVDQPVRLGAQYTTAGFFDLLGVRAAVGRTPLPEEERAGGRRVVLLTDGFWRMQLGGDASVLGRALTLNGQPYTVIGVLPPEFVPFAAGAQLVAPLAIESDPRRVKRAAGFLRPVGRLKSGTSLAAATAELDGIVGRLRAAFPDTNRAKLGVRLEPLADRIVGGYRRMLLVLQAAVVIVLLVACTNLANLFLSRVVGRRQELALRTALGASRGDLLRQLFSETVLLALCGGALGLLLAFAGVRALPALAPAQLPRLAEVRLGGWVLGFNLALSLAAGLAFGVLPALQGSRRETAEELRSGGRGTEGRRSTRARAALVLGEVGLALVLLVCGGLMLLSLRRLQRTDPGYRADHLLSVQLSLPKTRYGTPDAIDRYREELTRRVAALPGVARASAASLNPLTAWRASVSYTIEGRAEPSRDRAPIANYRAAGPGYFGTLGVPLLSGRELDERDRAAAPPVALVSASLARRHFPGRSALGARLAIDDTEAWRTVEIVGVVGDVKHTGLDADGTADVYVPYAQTPPDVSVWLANIFCVAVRTSADPRLSIPAVRQAIVALDPDVAASAVRTMDEALAESLADRRFTTRLIELFGAVALLLALAGVYATTAMGVAERRREIGVRLSVGASRRDILVLIVRRALAPVLGGILVGGAVALALGRVVSGLLFGVSAGDPRTLASAAIALGLAAAAASLLPALHATRIDPASVLRSE